MVDATAVQILNKLLQEVVDSKVIRDRHLSELSQ